MLKSPIGPASLGFRASSRRGSCHRSREPSCLRHVGPAAGRAGGSVGRSGTTNESGVGRPKPMAAFAGSVGLEINMLPGSSIPGPGRTDELVLPRTLHARPALTLDESPGLNEPFGPPGIQTASKEQPWPTSSTNIRPWRRGDGGSPKPSRSWTWTLITGRSAGSPRNPPAARRQLHAASCRHAGVGSSRTITAFETGVWLPSATLSSGTRTFASG